MMLKHLYTHMEDTLQIRFRLDEITESRERNRVSLGRPVPKAK